MQRSKVRDFLFHGFLVTDVEEFVEQAKLRNTESNCTYLDQYDECECRIVTEIDNIEEAKKIAKPETTLVRIDVFFFSFSTR